MGKLQSYKTRVAFNFEGFHYQLGDFQLRVGKVVPTHSESLRGIVMEMEYLPIPSWEKSHQIMGEFFDIWQEALREKSLPGYFVHIEPNFQSLASLINTLHSTQLHSMLASWHNVLVPVVFSIQKEYQTPVHYDAATAALYGKPTLKTHLNSKKLKWFRVFNLRHKLHIQEIAFCTLSFMYSLKSRNRLAICACRV